ncbi:unnamed protein product [Adineta steineri]|uniref:Uncharacterized protein n=1 Tax=Adineta steineri TaxID=433720 RepID=A0A815BHG9_9BILA|nr:unnamed protein product [Adineta steineri]CAF4095775.1 unnamed protein product [Adineta steineri]
MVNNNLETYSLFWLDASVNSQRNINAQQKLHSLINHLETFEHINECEQRIRSVSAQDRIVLIVSGQLGQQLVPRIHELRQIASIYVYCMDKQRNELWANTFSKIKGVIIHLNELVTSIDLNQVEQISNKVDEPIVIDIFNAKTKQEKSTAKLNGHFVHSQILIDCLLRMKSTPTDKKELVDFCLREYQNNNRELNNIHDFQKDYSPDRSIWWYTKDSFVYKLLNKALRVQDIHLIFLFRFFLRDIQKQLKQCRCLSFVRLYRGQLISNEELEILRTSIGQLISMNSLLSTTLNREQALKFLCRSKISDDEHRILFEIDADPQLTGIKPFAEIANLSYYPKEEEVLLMLGSIFRLNDISRNVDDSWNIQMTLCSDDDNDLKSIFDYMRTQDGDKETSLYSFGLALHKMDKFKEAEKYYYRYLDELPPKHEGIARCYWGLGNVAYDKKDYESSIDWHSKSLEIKKRTLKSDDPSLGHSYNSIANIHRKKGNLDKAVELYQEALMIWKQALGEDSLLVARCFNNLGIICKTQRNYSDALKFYKKDLAISQKNLPCDHSDIGKSHHNIANVYYSLGQYDLALEHYQLSLKIFEKSLPSQHTTIASTFLNIGRTYEQKGVFRDALSFYERAVIIYREVLSPTDSTVVDTEEDIQRVLLKLK